MEVKDISYYKKCFLHLSRSGRRGERAPHKLILLLAVFERVEELVAKGVAGQHMIERNLIDLNPKLEQYFYANWHKYIDSETFSPAFATPFYHMENEPFWTLVLKKDRKPASYQSESNLFKLYEGAYIDAELMAILTDEASREELRNYVLGLLSGQPKNIVSNSIDVSQSDNNEKEEPQLPETEIEKLFMQFMRDQGISEASVKKYALHVNHNSEVKEIVKKYTGKETLFSVASVEDIKQILQEVKTSPFNIRGNNMYSVGISHYLKFISGEEYQKKKHSRGDNWSEEEMILALNLYYNLPFSKFDKNTKEVQELAKIIGRTPSSVAMRLCNYEYSRTGKGLSGGHRQCKPYFDKYANNREQLEKDAQAILAKLQPSARETAQIEHQKEEDIHAAHEKFWSAFIRYNKEHNGIYASSGVTLHDWLGKRVLGIKGVSVNVIAGKKVCRSEIYINTGNKDENKQIFDFYYAFRNEINPQIPELIWQRLDDKEACRIRIDKPLSFRKPEDTEAIFEFFVTSTNLLVKVFAPYSDLYGKEDVPLEVEAPEQQTSPWDKLKSIFRKK